MKISEVTAQKLDQPFIPEEVYMEQMYKYWDSRIASYKGNQTWKTMHAVLMLCNVLLAARLVRGI